MEKSTEKSNLISLLTLNQMRAFICMIPTDLFGANIYIFQENITEPQQCRQKYTLELVLCLWCDHYVCRNFEQQ